MARAKSFYAVLPCEGCQRKTYHMDGVCCLCNHRTMGLTLMIAEQKSYQASPRVISIGEFLRRREDQALAHPEVSDEDDIC